MKVLVVGGGGREHTIAWKLSHSDLVKQIYAAPGNAGIADVATCLDLKADDITGIAKFAVADRDKTIGELSIGTDQCHEGRRRAGAAQTFDVWNTASCLSSALPEVIISVAPQITQY